MSKTGNSSNILDLPQIHKISSLSDDEALLTDNSSQADEDDLVSHTHDTDNSSEAGDDDIISEDLHQSMQDLGNSGSQLKGFRNQNAETYSDNSSEASEDDEFSGPDPYGTDDSSEAENDDLDEIEERIGLTAPNFNIDNDSQYTSQSQAAPGSDTNNALQSTLQSPLSTEAKQQALTHVDQENRIEQLHTLGSHTQLEPHKGSEAIQQPPKPLFEKPPMIDTTSEAASHPKPPRFVVHHISNNNQPDTDNSSEEGEDDLTEPEDYGSASFEEPLELPHISPVEDPKLAHLYTKTDAQSTDQYLQQATLYNQLEKQHTYEKSAKANRLRHRLYVTERYESYDGNDTNHDRKSPKARPASKTPKSNPSRTPIAKKKKTPSKNESGEIAGHFLARKKPSRTKDEEAIQFLQRMDQRAEHKRVAAKELQAKLDYEASLDKKSCPQCGRVQTFDQVKKRHKKCTECKILYRRTMRWTQVKDDFMKRNTVKQSTHSSGADGTHSKFSKPSRPNAEFLARMDNAAERRRRRNLRPPGMIENYSRQNKQERKTKRNIVGFEENQLSSVIRSKVNSATTPQIFDPEIWRAEQLVIAHLYGPCEGCGDASHDSRLE